MTCLLEYVPTLVLFQARPQVPPHWRGSEQAGTLRPPSVHSVGGVYAAGFFRLRSTSSFCFFFSLPIDSSVPSLAPHCGTVGKWEYLFSQQMASSPGPRGSVPQAIPWPELQTPPGQLLLVPGTSPCGASGSPSQA